MAECPRCNRAASYRGFEHKKTAKFEYWKCLWCDKFFEKRIKESKTVDEILNKRNKKNEITGKSKEIQKKL